MIPRRDLQHNIRWQFFGWFFDDGNVYVFFIIWFLKILLACLFVYLFVCLFNRSRHNRVHQVHNRSIHGRRIHRIRHSIRQDRIRRHRDDRSIRSRGQRDQPQPQGQPHASCGHQSQRPLLRQQGRQQGGGGGVHIRSHIRMRREL